MQTPRPNDQAIPVLLRSVFTRKFGSGKILSVGLQLTAFLHVTHGPDIYGVFSGSPQEVPRGMCQLTLSRRLDMTHSWRQRSRFCWNFFRTFKRVSLSSRPILFLSRMDLTSAQCTTCCLISPFHGHLPPSLILPSDHTCLKHI